MQHDLTHKTCVIPAILDWLGDSLNFAARPQRQWSNL